MKKKRREKNLSLWIKTRGQQVSQPTLAISAIFQSFETNQKKASFVKDACNSTITSNILKTKEKTPNINPKPKILTISSTTINLGNIKTRKNTVNTKNTLKKMMPKKMG